MLSWSSVTVGAQKGKPEKDTDNFDCKSKYSTNLFRKSQKITYPPVPLSWGRGSKGEPGRITGRVNDFEVRLSVVRIHPSPPLRRQLTTKWGGNSVGYKMLP